MRERSHGLVLQDVRDIVERVRGDLEQLSGCSLCITGASGLLARYMVETVAWCNCQVLANPCRLTAVVRREPDASDPLWARATECGLRVVVNDARSVPDCVTEADYLILAANKGSPKHYLREPVETLELNGVGLSAWLRFAQQAGSRAILYFSSGEIYGTPDSSAIPTKETYVGRVDPTAPRSVYAEGKRYGEALCLAFHRAAGVPVKIVRPFQVFGPGVSADDGRAFSSFVTAAALGQPIVLESAGDALRTFLYVEDATVAFWRVLLAGSAGVIYNVGSTSPEVSILELAQRVAAVAGEPSCVVVNCQTPPSSSASPARTCPDISRLQTDLKFSVRYGLDEMIARTLEWLRLDAN